MKITNYESERKCACVCVFRSGYGKVVVVCGEEHGREGATREYLFCQTCFLT